MNILNDYVLNEDDYFGPADIKKCPICNKDFDTRYGVNGNYNNLPVCDTCIDRKMDLTPEMRIKKIKNIFDNKMT